MKYPERQLDFDEVFRAVSSEMDIEIYDRNFNKNIASFMFPDNYHKYILGSLPPEEIDKAYKGYRYNINMNSVKYSNSMFARRVFELMASNTVVISNYSRGLKRLLGEYIICSDNVEDIRKQLGELKNEEVYNQYRLGALRKVFTSHLYEDRLREVINTVFKMNINRVYEPIAVIVVADTQQELEIIERIFNNQTYPCKQLVIISDLDIGDKGIKVISTRESKYLKLLEGIEAKYIIYIEAEEKYGENELMDLALGFKYAESQIISKCINYEDIPYTYRDGGDIEGALIETKVLEDYTLEAFLELAKNKLFVDIKMFKVRI